MGFKVEDAALKIDTNLETQAGALFDATFGKVLRSLVAPLRTITRYDFAYVCVTCCPMGSVLVCAAV